MLEATHFTIYTDHKPLCFAFHERKSNCSPRQYRHLDFISQFTTDIVFIAGKDNLVADTLSRVDELQIPVDLEVMAKLQATDPDLADLLKGDTSLRLTKTNVLESRSIVLRRQYTDTQAFRPSTIASADIQLPALTQPSRCQRHCQVSCSTLRLATDAEKLPRMV